MNEQAMKFRLGVFVLAALLLLAVLITLFGSFPRFLAPGTEYTVRFRQAPGVAPGTPVRRSGVRVGEVRRIELNDVTGHVRAVVHIDHPYSLRTNEVPRLTHGLLGGDVAIDFATDDRAADVRRDPVEPGAELDGREAPRVDLLLNQAGQVLPATQEALDEIKKSVQKFEKLAPVMEETLKEFRDLAKATREVVPEVKKSATAVRELADAAKEVFPEAKKTNDELRDLIKTVKEVVPEVKKTTTAVGELATATKESLPELKKTNDAIRQAATSVGDLAKAAQDSVPDLKKTNTEIQATLVTWQKVGERVKLLVETNEKKLEETLEHLNKTLQGVSSAFDEPNRKHLEDILKHTARGAQDLEKLSRDAAEFLREGAKTMKRVGDSVGKVDDVFGNLQAATKPLAERGGNVAKNLDESTGRLNDVLADVQALFRTLDKSDGSLKRFLTDASLYQKLEDLLCAATKLMPRLERTLRDVEVFADKIARHPETLGVGGAVRPNAGLKEAPSAPVWGRPNH